MDNKIKLIVFDLDGVLVSSKLIHYEAFNQALQYFDLKQLTYEDHLKYYDGLSTKQKIKKYEELNGEIDCKKCLWQKKQGISTELIKGYDFSVQDKVELLRELKKDYKIYIATNSTQETTEIILNNTGLIDVIDGYLYNTSVHNPKPHPEIYLKCMVEAHCSPNSTLIIEDNPQGVQSAMTSGGNYLFVNDPQDVNLEKIKEKIKDIERFPIKLSLKDDINIVVPMAGLGLRFKDAGYLKPKPLIDVNGEIMIKVVVDSLKINGHFIFLILKEHTEKFNIVDCLKALRPGCKVVIVDKLTGGAAETILLAKKYINNDNQVLVANSDQWIDWSPIEFLYNIKSKRADGGIVTFKSDGDKKWSYVEVADSGQITNVVEKSVLQGNNATIGLYFFTKGKDLVWAIEEMIKKNIRTNGEFYFAPCYNELIGVGKKILNYGVDNDKVAGLGTPTDLELFLTRFGK